MTNTETHPYWLDLPRETETWQMVMTGRGSRGAARVARLLSALDAAGWLFEVVRNVAVGRSVSLTIQVTGDPSDLRRLVREIKSQL